MPALKQIFKMTDSIIDEDSDEEGWAYLATVIQKLYKEYPEFTPKLYGTKNIRETRCSKSTTVTIIWKRRSAATRVSYRCSMPKVHIPPSLMRIPSMRHKLYYKKYKTSRKTVLHPNIVSLLGNCTVRTAVETISAPKVMAQSDGTVLPIYHRAKPTATGKRYPKPHLRRSVPVSSASRIIALTPLPTELNASKCRKLIVCGSFSKMAKLMSAHGQTAHGGIAGQRK